MMRSRVLLLLIVFTATGVLPVARAQAPSWVQETTKRPPQQGADLGSDRSDGWQKAINEASKRVDQALTMWKEGHRQEALTTMLIAHRDINIINTPSASGTFRRPPFDLFSGLYLAAMYDAMGETTEAYQYYHRALRPPDEEAHDAALRDDILLCYSEVCKKLGDAREAKWAFDQIADGDPLRTYLAAAERARAWGRIDVAERWAREALKLRPEDAGAQEALRLVLAMKAEGKRSEIG